MQPALVQPPSRSCTTSNRIQAVLNCTFLLGTFSVARVNFQRFWIASHWHDTIPQALKIRAENFFRAFLHASFLPGGLSTFFRASSASCWWTPSKRCSLCQRSEKLTTIQKTSLGCCYSLPSTDQCYQHRERTFPLSPSHKHASNKRSTRFLHRRPGRQKLSLSSFGDPPFECYAHHCEDRFFLKRLQTATCA